MSAISSATAAQYTSPKQRILDSISSQVSTGSISSADQSALDSAVESIDSNLQSGSSSSSSASLAPSDVKSRVDDLIAKQVSSGTLTRDQAETLKKVLSQGPAGHGHHHGVGGAGGPPPGPPPADDVTASADSSTDTSTSSDSASDLLAKFIKQLQSTQTQAAGYGANGTTGSSQTSNALLLNFQA